MSQNAQISDMGYRPYDGPRNAGKQKWMVIAKTMIRQTMKKPAYWITSLLFCLPWLFVGIFFYMQTSAEQAPFMNLLNDPVVFPSFFLRAYTMQRWGLLIVALICGAGSIASDNQANALMLYLSKPLTHGQYLMGKWMSVFIPVFMASFIPAIIICSYCWVGYDWQHFGAIYPWMFFQIIGCAIMPALVFASMLVGISAWTKTPRIAGAIMVSLYVLTNTGALIISNIMKSNNPDLAERINYYSIQGIINGINYHIMKIGVKTPLMTNPIMAFGPHGHHGNNTLAEAPFTIVLIAAVILCAAGIIAARMRIKAVEVVKG